MLEPWVAQSVSLPNYSSQFICMQMWDHPLCQPLPLPVHQLLPCRESFSPSCPSLSLLPVWLSVSSLTPWLSDFHTVRFSVSSGCFLFLNLSLSFGCTRRHSVSTIGLCLGWKSYVKLFNRDGFKMERKPKVHLIHEVWTEGTITLQRVLLRVCCVTGWGMALLIVSGRARDVKYPTA